MNSDFEIQHDSHQLIQYNKLLYFIGVCVTAILLNHLSEALLVSDDLFIEYFSEQLSYDRIVSLLEKQKKYFWMSYIFVPLILLIKITYSSCSIYSGYFVKNIKISFNTIFYGALLSEPVFLLPKLIKFFWFLFDDQYDLIEYRYFHPFSLLNLIEVKNIMAWYIYPLQLINLFEVFYCISIAWILNKVLVVGFIKTLKIVSISYGLGMLLYIVSILFLVVSLS